jgi:hemin uptake protein HemP
MSDKAKNWPHWLPERARDAAARGAVPPLRTPRVTTDRLMLGRREIVLQHGLEEYRLRITATGKLILTK